MSGKLLQAVWDYAGDDLNSTETHILARMAWYASDAGGDIFPSTATLCDQIKLGRTQLFENLKSLKHKEFIIPDGESKNKTIRYRINLAKLGLEQEFNEFSSCIPQKHPSGIRTPPVRNPDTPAATPVRNPDIIDMTDHYIKRHDHNDVKKTNVEPREKTSTKERLKMLNYEEKHQYDCLKRFKGLYDSVALSIVEQNTLGNIRNAIEMATTAAVDNPGAYIVKALYNKGVKSGASEGTGQASTR
jgi:hypothetical protein